MRISIACEDPQVARDAPAKIGIFVEINPGMDRTGVPFDDAATIRAVARAAGSRLRGVHWYEGHIRGGRPQSRRNEAERGYRALVELVAGLEVEAGPIREVVTSGTPTFLHALGSPALDHALRGRHRISPGTLIFHDLGYHEMLPEIEFDIAAALTTRVISRASDRMVTVDAGSKSIAAESGDPCAIALDHPGLCAQRPSEEHLPFRVESGETPPRGGVLYLVPRHICPTVNLADEALIMDGGSFVGFHPVAARGHETRAGAS